jgi:hypothetical protein
MECNNVSSIEELYYLKRCKNLTDVNLGSNPIASDINYYPKVQELLPRILSLDDTEVTEGFFASKIDEARRLMTKKTL